MKTLRPRRAGMRSAALAIENWQSSPTATAWGYYPSTSAAGGDMWFNNSPWNDARSWSEGYFDAAAKFNPKTIAILAADREVLVEDLSQRADPPRLLRVDHLHVDLAGMLDRFENRLLGDLVEHQAADLLLRLLAAAAGGDVQTELVVLHRLAVLAFDVQDRRR